MRVIVGVLLQWRTWRLAASFTPSPVQIAQLRLAAKFAPLDTEFCGAIDGLPGPAELQFAANPLFKFFTYDTNEDFTWVLREDVQQCLESVRNSNANGTEWIVQPSLWEAAELMYFKLGDTITPGDWLNQGWIEDNPTPVTSTVLRTASYRTAPMSSMPDQSFLQQPCNSLSNYAYYEISLEACKGDISDLGGTWPWQNEMTAVGALLAFGSFALHSNGARNPINSAFLDGFSIRCMFFLLFQAFVRNFAVDTGEPALQTILGVFPDQPFGDSRDVIRQFQTILGGPTSGWNSATDLDDALPEYELSAAAIVSLALYLQLIDTVGPVFTPLLYGEVCSFLVDALVPDRFSRRISATFDYVHNVAPKFLSPWFT